MAVKHWASPVAVSLLWAEKRTFLIISQPHTHTEGSIGQPFLASWGLLFPFCPLCPGGSSSLPWLWTCLGDLTWLSSLPSLTYAFTSADPLCHCYYPNSSLFSASRLFPQIPLTKFSLSNHHRQSLLRELITYHFSVWNDIFCAYTSLTSLPSWTLKLIVMMKTVVRITVATVTASNMLQEWVLGVPVPPDLVLTTTFWIMYYFLSPFYRWGNWASITCSHSPSSWVESLGSECRLLDSRVPWSSVRVATVC